MKYQVVKTSDIVADENQPRVYFDATKMGLLTKSIKEHGIKSPLIVEDMGNGKYLLEDGERRYRVAKEMGLKEVFALAMITKARLLIPPFKKWLRQ